MTREFVLKQDEEGHERYWVDGREVPRRVFVLANSDHLPVWLARLIVTFTPKATLRDRAEHRARYR